MCPPPPLSLRLTALPPFRHGSGSSDHTFRVWVCDPATAADAGDGTPGEAAAAGGGACERVVEGHSDSVTALVAWEEGGLMASGSLDGCVRLWSLDDWLVRSQDGSNIFPNKDFFQLC